VSTDPNQELRVLTESVAALAAEIATGRIDPQAGAKQLWLLGSELAPLEEELRVFAGLASEAEDAPANRDAYEREIMQAADRLRSRLEA
jgi:hypothetical protein